MGSVSERLLDAVYEAAVDDEAYAALSARLAAEMNGCSALFQEHEAGTVTIRSAHGFNFESLAEYTSHFAKCDAWVQAGVRAPADTAVALDRYVPQAEFERSELYCDYLRRHSDILHCLGMVMPFAGGRATVVAVHHARGQGGFDRDAEAWLQAFQPRLRRMMWTRWRRADAAERLHLPERVLDERADALICVDRRGAVHYANQAGVALLNTAGPLVRAAGGLRLRSGPDDARLQRAIADATSTGKSVSSMFTVSRELLLPVYVSVDPHQPHDPRQPLAAVTIRDAELHADRTSATAARSFGFTGAEAELARALVRGCSPDDYALKRGVRISTVRTQVRSLLAKSGAARTPELVSMILALPPG